MTTEPRIVAPQRKIGSRPVASETAAVAPEPPAKKGPGRKATLGIGAAIIAVVAAVYWFVVGPGAASEDGDAAAAPEPKYGPVQVIDPISVNLAGGRYLRLGLGMQLTDAAHGDIDTAKALDAAIALYSGRTQAELADPEVRETLKVELADVLSERYHGEVITVYYTDFVTQ